MATKTLMTQIGEILAGRLQALSDADRAYADTAIANLVDGAPETLDTLREIAEALHDHEDALDAITAAVAAHDHDDATQTVHGFMSAADKVKLDNLGSFADFLAAYNAGLDNSHSFLAADE